MNRRTQIRRKRIAFRLSLEDVARALNRTRAWLCQVELGNAVVDQDVFDRIDKTIERLNRAAISNVNLSFSDLALPSRRNRKRKAIF